MKKILLSVLTILSIFSLQLVANETPSGKVVGGISHEMPEWFKQSFLEIEEDIEEAADENKHLMIFLHLNDCPYCSKMADDLNSYQDKVKPFFDVIAINIKGDREVALNDMETMTEREMAQNLGVGYTPTMIFLNAKNEIVSRTNGYRKPQEFAKIMDFVKGKYYQKSDFATYKNNLKTTNNYKFVANKMFKNIKDLSTIKTPLAVIFESTDCVSCDYFHNTTLKNNLVQNEFAKYTVVRLNADSNEKITTPSGKQTTNKEFAKSLDLTYRPGIILFNKEQEKARIDGFLYTWHFSEMLRFISGNFQEKFAGFGEYLGFRTGELTSQGVNIDIGN
jgi:thioredoxin-related protein